MKQKKRFSAFIMMVLAFTVVLAACSSNNNGKTTETPSSKPSNTSPQEEAGSGDIVPFGEQPLEFSLYSNYDFSTPIGYGDDVTSKWMKETMKLNLIEIGSNGNAKQKFGTMMAANELPDAIMMDRGSPEYNTMVKNKLLVPLDEYYEKYPTLRNLIDDSTFNMLKHEDGHIYVIPNWFDSEKNPYKYSNTGWTVNRKIYKELGEPALATFEDLYAYLKQVKSKYPDVVPLETGITMNGVNMLFKLFYTGYGENRTIWNIGDIPRFPNTATSTMESIFNDSAYKEAFVWMNKLYREGLITQDMFTQKQEQVVEKLNSGRLAMTGFSNITGQGITANNILKASDPDAGYDYIPFLAAPEVDVDSVNPHTFGTLGWNVNVITSTAKEPERIFQFFDWFAGAEGQRLNSFGPPGVLYDEVDENGAPIDNERAKTISAEEKANLKLGIFNPEGSWMFYVIGHHKNAQNPETANWGNEASEFFGKYAKVNTDQFNNMVIDPKSDTGIVQEQIKQMWFEYNAKLIFAKSDQEFESTFEKLQTGVNKLGYDKVLEAYTKVWQANLELMK
ncbi:extracellular solute-binding protein [Paenibacillus luteus]|uniref:extracellular solute-binding protein n=1 Tax=Paenibacillus luteus TaxID=2545753 RepID=UPI001376034B|nr:extracellular solute-binding protein [Paenibacillus luteus]